MPLSPELFYDATGSDNGRSFVELYGDPGTVLDGLFLDGVNGSNGDVTVSVALLGAILGDRIFLLADEASGDGTEVAGADALANFDFQNGRQVPARYAACTPV